MPFVQLCVWGSKLLEAMYEKTKKFKHNQNSLQLYKKEFITKIIRSKIYTYKYLVLASTVVLVCDLDFRFISAYFILTKFAFAPISVNQTNIVVDNLVPFFFVYLCNMLPFVFS